MANTFGTSDATITSVEGHDRAWTSANRPTNLSVGMMGFNTTTGQLEVANGSTMSLVRTMNSANGLTATGTSSAGALALTGSVNNISTSSATSAPFNGVMLPAAAPGGVNVIINSSSNPIQVYGNGSDTINGVAATTGVTVPPNSVTTLNATATGAWFAQGIGFGYAGSLPTDTFSDALAAAGTNQSTALQLTSEINRITSGASTTGVALPLAAPGLGIIVINHAPNSIHVYGAGTDTIDDNSTTAGVIQMANSVALYFCATGAPAGKWYSDGIGTGYAGSYPTFSYADTITAAGTNQGAATALTAVVNRVTSSSATAAPFNGVQLPPSSPGMEITIENNSANPIQVYGAGTDTINGIAYGTGLSLGVNAVGSYACTTAGNWVVQLCQSSQPGIVSLTGSADALAPHTPHTYVVNKAGVDAMTLAAPTATTDDGIILVVTSNTANAHTITATGLLQTGTASVNTATFAAQKGASITLMAYQGKWNVLSANGITFS